MKIRNIYTQAGLIYHSELKLELFFKLVILRHHAIYYYFHKNANIPRLSVLSRRFLNKNVNIMYIQLMETNT